MLWHGEKTSLYIQNKEKEKVYFQSQEWIETFSRLAEAEGVTCVMLPFSHGNSFGSLPHSIGLPLSPIDWYAIIKYSQGYVGNNMHPIVVSLHNQVPFYSFDTYQFNDYNRYDATMIDARHKEEMRDTQFPKDLERAYELGKRLVNAAK